MTASTGLGSLPIASVCRGVCRVELLPLQTIPRGDEILQAPMPGERKGNYFYGYLPIAKSRS